MPNRLAQSQSLYLRKHADNPIDWWFWGVEALSLAQKEDRPIFLSIGYSSCHWCTVMEGEAFGDPLIAECLNSLFVPIKLDREERPDLDSIYMQAVGLMGIQGGWPLNLFLTPGDLIPFYGGTYFPVEPRYNRPGFLQVLQSVHHFYQEQKDKLVQIKQEILQGLQQKNNLAVIAQSNLLTKELLHKGIDVNSNIVGGSAGRYPSFPMIPYANITLQGSRLEDPAQEHRATLADQRGKDLALGGIFDHVAGGFHRYTVDATWTVPHFEKMLYDNGQIVEYLANLYSRGFANSLFERAVRKTVEWLQREMTAPQGYFYAAQDADSFTQPTESEPLEGAFYTWSYSELESLLTKSELALLEAAFTVRPEGNFEGQIVMQQRLADLPLPDELETALDRLFKVRYGTARQDTPYFTPARDNAEAKTKNWAGRIPPVTDTKMIVSWNSLMISGLARAFTVFQEPLYGDIAIKAVQFILEQQSVEGRLYRLNYQGKVSVLAQAEDYAFLIKALLDLQAAFPFQSDFLVQAQKLQKEFDQFFWSVETSGYFNTASDNSADLLFREKGYIDNATPAPNGVAITNLLRLFLLTDQTAYLQQAEQALISFSQLLQDSPQACPSLFSALDVYLHGQRVKARLESLEPLLSRYLPATVYLLAQDLPENTFALVCQGLSCLEAAKNQEELLVLLTSS